VKTKYSSGILLASVSHIGKTPAHLQLSVNTLASELERGALAEAIHYLKLWLAKRRRSREGRGESRSFWQKRYYDRNVRDAREFSEPPAEAQHHALANLSILLTTIH
jgi:siroheme synthase (precorrin-2 oxidase/ferrochelatase)